MQIGLPRALLYHYYYPFWKAFFTELGFDVVISDLSSKSLVQEGIKVTVPEICLPIKIFNGHVLNLLETDVDYIFLPRFVSIGRGEWCCPKFLGLPELVEYTIPATKDKILTLDIKTAREDLRDFKDYGDLIKVCKLPKRKIKAAQQLATEKWVNFRKNQLKEMHNILTNRTQLTLGVLGYVYNIYDPFISLDIIARLKTMDVQVITFDMLQAAEIDYREDKKNIFWTFTNKLYGTANKLIEKQLVDGIIHVTAFGCGPDSVLGKFLEVDCDQVKVPFMTLRVDEHTGESHLQTRIEAFVDMLKRKKLRELKGDLA